jgi:hypothetical protein
MNDEAVSGEVRERLLASSCHLSTLEDGRLRLRDPDGAVLYITRLETA